MPLGISSDRVLTLDIPLPVDRYKIKAERVASLKRYLAAIRETPGVVAVSLNTGLHPLGNLQSSVEVDGSNSPNAPTAVIHQVDQQYFPVFRIPLVEGRTWTETDIAEARRYAIVNQAFERLYLSGKSAFGVSVRIPPMASLFGGEPFQIVGVTADVRNQGLLKGVAPEVYVPYTFTGMSRHLVVRTASDPTRLTPAIVASIRRLDSEQLITNVMSMDTLLEKRLLSLSRFELVLFGSFAAMGLLLAIAGIYGVVSNATVETWRRELGVRLALGAPGSTSRVSIEFGYANGVIGNWRWRRRCAVAYALDGIHVVRSASRRSAFDRRCRSCHCHGWSLLLPRASDESHTHRSLSCFATGIEYCLPWILSEAITKSAEQRLRQVGLAVIFWTAAGFLSKIPALTNGSEWRSSLVDPSRNGGLGA